jgi:hypothetical protein
MAPAARCGAAPVPRAPPLAWRSGWERRQGRRQGPEHGGIDTSAEAADNAATNTSYPKPNRRPLLRTDAPTPLAPPHTTP